MKVRASFFRLSLLFLCFLGLIVSYAALAERFPLKAVRAYTAEVATKQQVNFVKQLVSKSISRNELIQLLDGSGEISIIEIDRFPFNDSQDLDPWGVPVLITLVRSKAVSAPPDFGVYSKGPDGISLSHGNDEDDISSWASVDNAYWRRVHRDSLCRLWIFRVELAAGLAIMSYVAVSAYKGWRQKSVFELKQKDIPNE